jgi:hypothetical protein
MPKRRIPEAPLEGAATPTKAGWRISEWARDTGLGRSSVYNEIKAKRVKAVKSGSATIITTSPAEYLASLRGEAS